MDRKFIEDFDRKQKASKNKRSKEREHGQRSKHSVKSEEPELPRSAASYRDRAKERREGLNRDFELDPDDLFVSNPIKTQDDSDDDEQMIDERERRRQQIEESKYLGGDVEHTHLVKGLDFALLEKVKNDQKLAERLAVDRDHRDSEDSDDEVRNEAILAATSSSRGQISSADLVQCKTAIGRRVMNVLFAEKWPEKSDLFLPGRMTYRISLDTNEITTIIRSKTDTSKIDTQAK